LWGIATGYRAALVTVITVVIVAVTSLTPEYGAPLFVVAASGRQL
jgi:hypothetical protein